MADKWMEADPPNYYGNEDLMYPYSELPHFSGYHLVRIPTDEELVEHVDYWGEGRFEHSAGITGFRECYNVNSQYQLVSDGPDKGCKIPNRIPVLDENSCDTSDYIKSQTVKLVTYQGDDFHAQRSITESCAKDIARIVNSTSGSVVVFGFEIDAVDIRLLGTELSEISMFYCPGYELPSYFDGLTLYDTHIVFLNVDEIEDRLYKAFAALSFDTAAAITLSLDRSGGSFVITKVVDKLLEQHELSTMSFAYKLWDSGEKEIVKKYFPDIFQLIFNEKEIVIVSNYFDNAMFKLDVHSDEWGNKLAWADSSGDNGIRFSWTMVPIWKDNEVVFKIKNYGYDMFLRLDIHDNNKGDRKCYGSEKLDEVRYDWKLQPIKLHDNVVFYIVNCQYNMVLKLDKYKDQYEDRQVWGHYGYFDYEPEFFAMILRSYYID